MNLPDGAFLGYILTRESWFAGLSPDDPRAVNVYIFRPGDAVTIWEFYIRDHQYGNGPRVEMYDDSWAAFTQIPEFFTGLAGLGEYATFPGICGILDGLGAIDMTQRKRPQQMCDDQFCMLRVGQGDHPAHEYKLGFE